MSRIGVSEKTKQQPTEKRNKNKQKGNKINRQKRRRRRRKERGSRSRILFRVNFCDISCRCCGRRRSLPQRVRAPLQSSRVRKRNSHHFFPSPKWIDPISLRFVSGSCAFVSTCVCVCLWVCMRSLASNNSSAQKSLHACRHLSRIALIRMYVSKTPCYLFSLGFFSSLCCCCCFCCGYCHCIWFCCEPLLLPLPLLFIPRHLFTFLIVFRCRFFACFASYYLLLFRYLYTSMPIYWTMSSNLSIVRYIPMNGMRILCRNHVPQLQGRSGSRCDRMWCVW